MFVLNRQPRNMEYNALIDLCCEVCDEFQLVLRKDLADFDDYREILNKLSPSLKEMKEESEWATTILGDGQTAYVYYYYANEHTKNLLKELSNSLYGWVHPNLLEDLSFFKNGKEWMVSSSHEEESYIFPENEEEIESLKQIKGLKCIQEDDE
ncbi:stage III sporulation protein AH [Bacillus pumilus]|uniref:stage III sporulation protein AH n=1 Tax=Bacillus pumilus TaxID=1408 RepID=UPI0011A3D94B|nr:stage III sporulation protein AH [Bacillus pumilus]